MMDADRNLRIFVACAPGLESVLAAECARLGLAGIKQDEIGTDAKDIPGEEPGGLEFAGSLADVYRGNLHLRTASRVVVRLGEFYAAAFSELRKKASRLPWENFLKPGQPVALRAVCHKSKLYHSDAVAERVLGAIDDHFAGQGKPAAQARSAPDGQLILVRLVHDKCTISVDSSGELLHRRGYRQALAKAPLRETLAAGMLLASGWDRRSPLIDPFCGSGTIPIEAAMLAGNIPPGVQRRFRFMDWPTFSPQVLDEVFHNARSGIQEARISLFGFDRDAGAIEMAIANAARAGLDKAITFRHQALSYLEPASTPGWIVTNPPYGVRINEGKDLRNLYARFGSLLQERFTGWQVAILCSSSQLTAALGLGQPLSTLRLVNGGIPVQLVINII